MRSNHCIVLFIGIAETALFFVDVVPLPYNFILMFLNGLPLGMIWGSCSVFLKAAKTRKRWERAFAPALSFLRV